jgi:hypothetical protein
MRLAVLLVFALGASAAGAQVTCESYCEGLRCKPELFKGKAPEWFAVAWSRARPL